MILSQEETGLSQESGLSQEYLNKRLEPSIFVHFRKLGTSFQHFGIWKIYQIIKRCALYIHIIDAVAYS